MDAERLARVAAMARSIALSGERWSDEAEAEYRAALAAPAVTETAHAPDSITVAGHMYVHVATCPCLSLAVTGSRWSGLTLPRPKTPDPGRVEWKG